MTKSIITATAILAALTLPLNIASAGEASSDMRKLCGKSAEIHEDGRACSWGTRMAPWKFSIADDPITNKKLFTVETVDFVFGALLSIRCRQPGDLNMSVLMLGRVLSLTGAQGKLGKEVDVPVVYRVGKNKHVKEIWRTGKFEAHGDTRRDLILGAMTGTPGQAAALANALSTEMGQAVVRIDDLTATFNLKGSTRAIGTLRKKCKF
ncbi:MAG: hypothetical protein OEU46_15325 [Alphaproteobacteria bacterium]|nr:hypothetical protein [Alphaproteobacteria bacterium]